MTSTTNMTFKQFIPLTLRKHARLAPVLAALLASISPTSADPPSYAIRNVTVIDVKQGKPFPARTVIISGDTITTITDIQTRGGNAAGAAPVPAPLPAGATVIDGSGLFLIPGLTDAHVHYVDPETYGRLFLAHGVTLVRETGNDTKRIIAIRDELRDGSRLGPQMICCGAIVDGVPPVWPFSEACDTPEEARAAIHRLYDAGVNQIKVYSKLKPDVYAAAVDEARKVGLKATGHIPFACDIDDAIAAGQACDEHLMGFEKLIAKLAPAEIPDEVKKQAGIYAGMSAWGRMATVDRAALQAELKKIAKAGMHQCPTIVVMAGIGSTAPDPTTGIAKPNTDPRLAYVSATMKSFWESPMYQGGFAAFAQSAVEPMQAMTAELFKAGVPLMIGTDLANPYVYAGASVHDEMRLFAQAGIPPADVLRSATIIPAAFFGLDAKLGSVEEGKTASLVLLSANPLDDITNTTKIAGVFRGGHYYDRAALDKLLEEAKSLAAAQPGADAANAAAAAAVKLDLPGEVVARGHYKVTFGNFDAGTEDFLITKTAEGYSLIAHNQPKGGMQQPILVTLHLAPDKSFKSGSYKQLAGPTIEAAYTLAGDKLEAKATSGGKNLDPQSIPLPDGASIGAPIYSSDFMGIGSLALNVGEERQMTSVSFGYPDWRWASCPMTINREPDTTLKGADGNEIAVRLYKSVISTPVGQFKGDTWIDEHAIVHKSITVMPFGTITAVLE